MPLYVCPHCKKTVSFLADGELDDMGEFCPKRGCRGFMEEIDAPDLEGFRAFVVSLEKFLASLTAMERETQ